MTIPLLAVGDLFTASNQQAIANAVNSLVASQATAAQLTLIPGTTINTPLSGASTWLTLGNVTVPTWATQVIVDIAFVSITGSSGINNTSMQIKVGSAAGLSLRIPGSGSAAGTSWAYTDKITGISPGTQSVTIFATWNNGTTPFQAVTASLITAHFGFLA